MPPSDSNAKVSFTYIADTGMWTYGDSIDGDYSNASHCQRLIDPETGLVPLLKKWNLKSIFDASCGGHHWSREIDFAGNDIQYIGGEIVDSKIAKLKEKFPEKDFRVFDIIEDKFPDVDVWLCKDTMIHFPIRYIHKTLRNFLTSNVPYCLLTVNHRGIAGECNNDIPEFGPHTTGGNCSYNEWCLAPFNFPEPLDVLEYTNGSKTDRVVKDLGYRMIDVSTTQFFLYLYHRDQFKDLPFIVNDYGA